MSQNTRRILALTDEAAAIAEHGRITFATPKAAALLGGDCTGKSVRELLGDDIAGTQSRTFLADLALNGKSCVVRVSEFDGEQLLFFSGSEPSVLPLGDPFLCALRDSLMSMGVTLDTLRELEEDRNDPESRAAVTSLTRGHYRLLRLNANASLTLAKLQGCLPFQAVPLDVSDLFAKALEGAAGFLPQLKLISDLGEHLSLAADPALLVQLLHNLLSNCIVHAQGCDTVRVSLVQTPSSLVLSVINNGSGIPPEELHKVFERYRYPFPLTGMHGPGLGLTVCRGIAECHGGTVLLESNPDRGTSVRVSLSRQIKAASLKAPAAGAIPTTQDILIGLADCLPPECFTEKYMD